jgi:GNAT superfamily N-acetyltransferase
VALIRATLSRCCAVGCRYVQALLPEDQAGHGAYLKQSGFRLLTTLLYLERDARYPWVASPEPDEAAWIAYVPERRAAFVNMIRATYANSLDCPELSELRSAEDALAAHGAAGAHDGALWELMYVGEEPVGCLLLTEQRASDAMEVTYMGIHPGYRGHGSGALLLRRALERCRAQRMRRITLAVDARNAPARRLYEAFGLRCFAKRIAYVHACASLHAPGTRAACES